MYNIVSLMFLQFHFTLFQFHMFPFKTPADEDLKFKIADVRGFEKTNTLLSNDMEMILDGHIMDGYEVLKFVLHNLCFGYSLIKSLKVTLNTFIRPFFFDHYPWQICQNLLHTQCPSQN